MYINYIYMYNNDKLVALTKTLGNHLKQASAFGEKD